MPLNRQFLTLAAVATLAAASTANAAYYKYDDGQTDTGVGPPATFPSNPVTGWGNYFTTPAGGDTISAVQIAFGPTWPTRGPVTVYLFADPDGDNNPGNATLLTSVVDTPANIGLSTFNTFTFATPQTVNGSFFVLAATDTVKGADRMPAEDDTAGAPIDKSWLIYNPVASGINTASLSSNAYFHSTIGALPFNGVWMIRAVGAPEPASFATLASIGAIALRRRRR